MGPAKRPVSSRVITKDDWHLGIVISIMVVGPRRVVSPPSILGPLQNIYSPFCRWKNNSPLVHRRNITKREWISPLMFQRIKRRTPAHTQTCIYKQEPRKKERERKHTDTLYTYQAQFFWATRSNFGIGGSVAGATPVQRSPFLSIFRIRIQEDDFILDDLIRLTIWISSFMIQKICLKYLIKQFFLTTIFQYLNIKRQFGSTFRLVSSVFPPFFFLHAFPPSHKRLLFIHYS